MTIYPHTYIRESAISFVIELRLVSYDTTPNVIPGFQYFGTFPEFMYESAVDIAAVTPLIPWTGDCAQIFNSMKSISLPFRCNAIVPISIH